MAKSQYEYVKGFEREDSALPNTFIVVRVDGRGFHKFVEEHGWRRPNDERGLRLMIRAAQAVMCEFRGDAVLAYGESDEFSFVFRRRTTLYGRRVSKLISLVASTFAGAFVFHWGAFFGEECPLRRPPAFDARAVCYPTVRNLRDYLAWRQADCHINNLYNTCFWALVQQGGLSLRAAHDELSGTDSAQKNELLFSRFGTNYAHLPALYRKGATLIWPSATSPPPPSSPSPTSSGGTVASAKAAAAATTTTDLPLVLEVDIIQDDFWRANPGLLEPDS